MRSMLIPTTKPTRDQGVSLSNKALENIHLVWLTLTAEG